MSRRVARIEIDNLLGTKHFVIKPGTLTTITGGNEAGKTSVLRAVMQFFVGGYDPGLLRKGAKVGTCVLTLDDGTQLKMRQTAKDCTYEVIPAGADKPIGAPRKYLDELGELLAVNPAGLLAAKPKDFAKSLLEIMPITFSHDELQVAVPEDVHSFPMRELGLDELRAQRDQIYKARATANKDAKESAATAKRLRENLPESNDQDWAAQLQSLKDADAALRAEQQLAIDKVRAVRADELARLQEEFDRLKTGLLKDEQIERDEIADRYAPQINKVATEIGQTQEAMRNKDRAEGIRLSMVDFEEKAEKSMEAAERLDDAIKHIDTITQTKLSSLPIPGLTVENELPYFEGVAFEHVNLAKRIDIGFQVCALRAGTLPFILMDDAEHLDPQTWEAFKEGAVNSGFQILAARVGEGPLAIETLEPETVLA